MPSIKTKPSLEEYRKKRNFRRTPEPSGTGGDVPRGNFFVIQKHAASHLHYDLRLAFHGSLKSWAITKGPSSDPVDRRLARQTEDHPLEYGLFEGVIPAGEYGGGTVMVWDTGEWEPLESGKQEYYRGKLHFILHGRRLRGKWSLIREEGHSRNWYLQKEPDDYTTAGGILQGEERSVLSGRTMEEIAASGDAVWTQEQGLVTFLSPPLPDYIAPQLATLVTRPPDGEEWLHEIKFDGYRIVCLIDKAGSGIRFFTRKKVDFTDRLGALKKAVEKLPVSKAWLDGEIVVLTEDGRSDFNALQNAFTRGSTSGIIYMVFDLMNLNGIDMRQTPLSERKALLSDLVPDMEQVRYVDHVIGNGPLFYEEACRHNLEGVVSKKIYSRYASERNREWIKVKCAPRGE